MPWILGIAAAAAVAALVFVIARNAFTREVAEQRAAMREAFQSVALDALKSTRADFLDSLESRQKAFDGLVQPIADTLKKVDTKLAEAERERLEAYARLTEKVSALGSSADSLARALRTPSVR